MKLKTIALLLLTAMLAVTLLACSDSGESDLEYVIAKDKLIIGITYYAPMDYKDADGKLIGFDHDLAAAVCAELGVEPVFQEIDWNTKENELNSKTIDVIWNGMTVDAKRAEAMSLTKNYMLNKQVVVVSSALASATTVADLSGKKGAAEAGSAGEEIIKAKDELKDNLVSVQDQSTALLEVKTGTSDYCVIDAVMANYLVGEGTDFAELTVLSELLGAEDEYYAAACRKGSDLTAKINEILLKLDNEGEIVKIAEKYGLKDVLVPIK